MITVPLNVGSLGKITGDASRMTLDVIKVTETRWKGNAAGYRLEATDGARLAIVRGPCPPCPLQLPAEMADTNIHAAEYLVPVSMWERAFKFARSLRDAKTMPVLVCCVGSEVRIVTAGGGLFTGKQPDGRFPDTARVLPQSLYPAVVLSPKLLASLCKLAEEIDTPHDGKVYLRLNPLEGPHALYSTGEPEQTLDMLLMPFSGGPADGAASRK